MLEIAGLVVAASLAVGQTEIPPEAQTHLEKHVGTWVGEWEYGNDVGNNRLYVKMSPRKQAILANLLVKGTVEGDEIDSQGSILMGWHADTKQLVETNYTSGGGRVTLRWTIESPDKRVGTSHWVDADGNVSEGKCKLKFDGPNAFTITDYDRVEGDKNFPTLVIKYQRVEPEARPTKAEFLKAFKYFIGSWKASRDDGGTAEWVFEWGPDKNSIENKIAAKNGKGEVVLSNSGVIVWDAGNRRYVNVCVNAEGNRIDFLWNKSGDTAWETWLRGTQDSGKVSIINENKWTLTWGDQSSTYERQE